MGGLAAGAGGANCGVYEILEHGEAGESRLAGSCEKSEESEGDRVRCWAPANSMPLMLGYAGRHKPAMGGQAGRGGRTRALGWQHRNGRDLTCQSGDAVGRTWEWEWKCQLRVERGGEEEEEEKSGSAAAVHGAGPEAEAAVDEPSRQELHGAVSRHAECTFPVLASTHLGCRGAPSSCSSASQSGKRACT